MEKKNKQQKQQQRFQVNKINRIELAMTHAMLYWYIVYNLNNSAQHQKNRKCRKRIVWSEN